MRETLASEEKVNDDNETSDNVKSYRKYVKSVSLELLKYQLNNTIPSFHQIEYTTNEIIHFTYHHSIVIIQLIIIFYCNDL